MAYTCDSGSHAFGIAGSNPAFGTKYGRVAELGIRAGLRFQCLRDCGFKSHLGHQKGRTMDDKEINGGRTVKWLDKWDVLLFLLTLAAGFLLLGVVVPWMFKPM